MIFIVCLDTLDNPKKPCMGAYKGNHLIINPNLNEIDKPYIWVERWFIEFRSIDNIYKFMRVYQKISLEIVTGFERLLIIDSSYTSYGLSLFDESRLIREIFLDET